MTREEALSKAIMTLIYFQEHFCKSKEAVDNTQAIIDTLEQIEQETRWIPVSERLPEKDDLYLIYFDDGEYNLAYFSHGAFGYNGAFGYSGVIAWMPLPEPYKAESEVQE